MFGSAGQIDIVIGIQTCLLQYSHPVIRIRYVNPGGRCMKRNCGSAWPFLVQTTFCGTGPSDFNPPTPWGVGPPGTHFQTGVADISIHPPRGGWDGGGHPTLIGRQLFQSTHPVGGGTASLWTMTALLAEFQSTHPVGGGTMPLPLRIFDYKISIHPPRGGWDALDDTMSLGQFKISNHPPRGGWDQGRIL